LNTAKLKSIMVLHGDTGGKLAEAISISQPRFSAKLNERCGAEFTLGEIRKIKKRYGLTMDEIEMIFFAKEVS